MKNSVAVIGSGFSSLSAACYLAKAGYEVDVYEKNGHLGGRARQFSQEGFTFDMGPTWYWMPDIFERFFSDFGKKPSDYYELERLDPAYRVYFDQSHFIDIDASLDSIIRKFESIESGAGKRLERFIAKAKSNYLTAMTDLVYQPGESPLELISGKTIREIKQFYLSISDHVRKNFRDPKLQMILEFPVLFLGAKPSNTPLFYNFMNYADFGLGTWHPTGGMKSVVDGFVSLAKELGVKFHLNANVSSINVNGSGRSESMTINGMEVTVSTIVAGADYKHVEGLLPTHARSYSERSWDKRIMAPSSLLFYVAFSEKLENLCHHTLFFDSSFEQHASEIYDTPAWPAEPLFYASFPSITDPSMAPSGKEAATILIPLAPDLEDNQGIRDQYFDMVIERMEELTGQRLKENILFHRSYCVNDFKKDYNSFKGNAYGMANTLRQTAFLRPGIRSKKVNNLFFTGQLTVPGPGVPPSLISGKIAADMVEKHVGL